MAGAGGTAGCGVTIVEETVVLVNVTASRGELFDLFAALSPERQRRYAERFRAVICGDEPPGTVGFRQAEWAEIAAEGREA